MHPLSAFLTYFTAKGLDQTIREDIGNESATNAAEAWKFLRGEHASYQALYDGFIRMYYSYFACYPAPRLWRKIENFSVPNYHHLRAQKRRLKMGYNHMAMNEQRREESRTRWIPRALILLSAANSKTEFERLLDTSNSGLVQRNLFEDENREMLEDCLAQSEG